MAVCGALNLADIYHQLLTRVSNVPLAAVSATSSMLWATRYTSRVIKYYGGVSTSERRS